MIIKALTRRSSGPGQLVKYIFRYIHAEEKKAGQTQFIIRHNIRSRTIEGYINEFKQNELNRIHKRTDQTIINHFILSFSPADSAHITDTKLKSITKRFIQLRGDNNLYCGTKHLDKGHIHLHIACSGTSLNGLSARISKSDLANLKVELDKYQKDNFPELTHSLPNHGQQQKLNKESLQFRWKKSKETDKQMLANALDRAYTKSKSVEEFLNELKVHGHEPYHRDGKLAGVKFEGNRKFRLSTLGFEENKIINLELKQTKEDKELTEIKNLRVRLKLKSQEKETASRERILEHQPVPGSFPNLTEGFGDIPTRSFSQDMNISPG